jgi:DNA-binding NtrC family response regulator
MLTTASDPKTIVSAIKAGANDYVVKDTPNTEAEIRFQLHQALEFRRLRDRTKKLEAKLAQQSKKYEIIGLAPSVLKLLSNIAALQGKPASVLIHGESVSGANGSFVGGGREPSRHVDEQRYHHPAHGEYCPVRARSTVKV